jgi:hypothetical protein
MKACGDSSDEGERDGSINSIAVRVSFYGYGNSSRKPEIPNPQLMLSFPEAEAWQWFSLAKIRSLPERLSRRVRDDKSFFKCHSEHIGRNLSSA